LPAKALILAVVGFVGILDRRRLAGLGLAGVHGKKHCTDDNQKDQPRVIVAFGSTATTPAKAAAATRLVIAAYVTLDLNPIAPISLLSTVCPIRPTPYLGAKSCFFVTAA